MIISKEILEELYFKQNKTQYEIAEILGVTQSCVSANFVKYGFDFRSKWTKEDIEYLEDNFGLKNIKTLARKLNRSEDAVIIKAKKIGLGGITETTNCINASQLADAIGADAKTVLRWINDKGLKARKIVLAKEKAYWQIKLENFWKWASINKDRINWAKFEVNNLGKEPLWVEEIRKRDLAKPKNQNTKWTKEQEKKLIMYWNAGKTASEIAKIMNRTKEGVWRKVARLGLDKRVVALPFKKIEDEILINMKLNGAKDIEIAEELGRSYGSVSFRRKTLIKEGKLNWKYRDKKATKNPNQSILSSTHKTMHKNSTSLYHSLEVCQ